ncbi:hypothetical protein G6F55_014163 [Rhizopus delemar]|nr:hypothetical protein G6F55_014163 [Rhizopus delemar]
MEVRTPVAANAAWHLSMAGLAGLLGRDLHASITRTRRTSALVDCRQRHPTACAVRDRAGLAVAAPTPLARELRPTPTSGTPPAHAGRSAPWPRRRTPTRTPPPWPRRARRLREGAPARTPG